MFGNAPQAKTSADIGDQIRLLSLEMQTRARAPFAPVIKNADGSITNAYAPSVKFDEAGGVLAQAMADFQQLLSKMPAGASPLIDPTSKTDLATVLGGHMTQAVQDLAGGKDFNNVQDLWKLGLAELANKTVDTYNKKIDDPATSAAQKKEWSGLRDQAMQQLDALQKTDNNSKFNSEVKRVKDAMSKQNERDLQSELEKQTRAQSKYVCVNNLEKDGRDKTEKEIQEKIKEDAANALKKGGASAGPVEIIQKSTGYYKLKSEASDQSIGGLYYDQKSNSAWPLPEPLDAGEYSIRGASNFKEVWTKIFGFLASTSKGIEIDSQVPKNVVAMVDIICENHKDRYININTKMTQKALTELSERELNEVMSKVKFHNDNVQKHRTEAVMLTMAQVEEKIKLQKSDVNVEADRIANQKLERLDDDEALAITALDAILKDVGAGLPLDPQHMEVLERASAEIARQSAELAGFRNDVLNDAVFKVQDQIDKIQAVVGNIVNKMKDVHDKIPVPTVPGVADTYKELRDKLTSLSGNMKSGLDKVADVVERKEQASRPKPGTP